MKVFYMYSNIEILETLTKFASESIILFLVEKSHTKKNCLLDCLYVRRVKRTSILATSNT